MTFLDKYELLKKSIPVPAVFLGEGVENCKMVDDVPQSKNLYYCFECYKLEDSMYCVACWGKNLVDCTFGIECELCYWCIDSNKCYNSTYLTNCNSCRDCHYSALCISCTDCFGCVGLTHKQYCIFNKQYTEEEYNREIAELKKQNPEKVLQKMLELKKQIPHPASQQYNNENCPYGDYIYDSKNSYWCFNGYWLEDCGFSFTSAMSKRSWDIFLSGGNENAASELAYELTDCGGCYNCAFLIYSDYCTNCYHGSYLRNCTDCFGCVGLSNKKYCILNNQLTKEKYEEALVNIKKELGWKV